MSPLMPGPGQRPFGDRHGPLIQPPRTAGGDHARARRGGELMPSAEFPRVGLAGPPNTQVEVSHTPGYTHAVITVLGGENMAACGIQSEDLRAHIRHCEQLLSRMEPGA